MSKESIIQRDIMQYLKKRNIYHWRTPNLTIKKRKNIVKKGVSDILGLYKKFFFALEVKKQGGILSEEQKEFHYEVEKEGHKTCVAYSLDDAVRFFNEAF